MLPSETITELPEIVQLELLPIFSIELASKRCPQIAPEDEGRLASALIAVPKSIVRIKKSFDKTASSTAVVPLLHLKSSAKTLRSFEPLQTQLPLTRSLPSTHVTQF